MHFPVEFWLVRAAIGIVSLMVLALLIGIAVLGYAWWSHRRARKEWDS